MCLRVGAIHELPLHFAMTNRTVDDIPECRLRYCRGRIHPTRNVIIKTGSINRAPTFIVLYRATLWGCLVFLII